MKKFELIKQSEVKVRGSLSNIKFIPEKYNLVALGNSTSSIKLYDFNLAKKREGQLEYTEPLLELTTTVSAQLVIF